MSVNVYLNNKVRDLPGFKSKPYSEASGNEMSFKGTPVYSDKGRLCIKSDENAVVPEELEELVEEISLYESIPKMGCRECGIYRHESARCELTTEYNRHNKEVYRLKITAKNMEDINTIMHKVKTGTIRPEESYEGAQSGLSRKKLEEIALQRDRLLNLLNSTNAEAERLTRELEATREELKLSKDTFRTHQQNFTDACEKNVRLRQLAQRMENWSLFPLIGRGAIAEEIYAILDGKK